MRETKSMSEKAIFALRAFPVLIMVYVYAVYPPLDYGFPMSDEFGDMLIYVVVASFPLAVILPWEKRLVRLGLASSSRVAVVAVDVLANAIAAAFLFAGLSLVFYLTISLPKYFLFYNS